MKTENMETWVQTTIDELCRVSMGQSPSSDSYNSDKIGLPFFQGKAEFTELYPIAIKWCSKPKVIAEKDDILLSVRAPVGSINIADQVCCIGRGLAALQYKPCYKFLYYYLLTKQEYLKSLGTGTTFTAISGKDVKKMPVPLPPLPEQRAIVAKLETLLSDLDNAVATLKQAKEQIKTYRQAVLKAAFTGKLTEEWRKQQTNLPTADELLSHIQTERKKYCQQQLADIKAGKFEVKPLILNTLKSKSVNIPYGHITIPEPWVEVELGELAKVSGGKRLPKGHDYSIDKSNYPYIRVSDFGSHTIESAELKYLNQDTYVRLMHYAISRHDLYMSIAGTIGKTGWIPDNLDGGILTENAAKISGIITVLNKRYLAYYLSSLLGQKQIQEKTKVTTQPKLALYRIESISINTCSYEEQQQIVSEIESRFSIAENLDHAIEESHSKTIALKQSLLKQAFEGKLLTEEELEQTRQASDWEPAERLLERIMLDTRRT